jgi:8-oxo-dGTP pyrophosphatase MutT (NUDIX family)
MGTANTLMTLIKEKNMTPIQYRSAGGIVLREMEGQRRYLIIKQVRGNGEVQWVMPKGTVEPGESDEETARREVLEEVGLGDLKCEAIVGSSRYPFTDSEGRSCEKTVTWFLFRSVRQIEVDLRATEGFVESVWLPIDQAKERCTHEDFRELLQKADALVD